jgi:hypothetical protein
MIKHRAVRGALGLAAGDILEAVRDLRECLAHLADGWPEEELLWPVQLLDLVETRARTIRWALDVPPAPPLPLSSTVPH